MAIRIRTVDPTWFDFVSSRPDLTEINLWTPAGRRILDDAQTGDLIIFHAWQLFGPDNGAPTSEAFRTSVVTRHPAKRSTF